MIVYPECWHPIAPEDATTPQAMAALLDHIAEELAVMGPPTASGLVAAAAALLREDFAQDEGD